jgi:heterotetrameric sarcosine oxidase gamma subunit
VLDVRSEGVLLSERTGFEMVQLTAWPSTRARTRQTVSSILGLEPPEKPNTVSSFGPLRVLSLGPHKWLVVRPARTLSLRDQLGPQLDCDTATLVDFAAGRCVFSVSGERSRDLLAKHLPLDLSEPAFPVGSCAQSAIGHVGVLLEAESRTTFVVYVYRSLARHLSEMLADAALAL